MAAVADAATADPSAAVRLLDTAKTSSLAELREERARTKAAACPDPEARRRDIHSKRSLRTYTDREGIGHLHLRDNPERVAEVMAAVVPIRDRLFKEARVEGRREASEAYAADALVELATMGGPATGRPKAKILGRVDLAALLRGRVAGDEVCEIAGFGPVGVSAVRDMIDTADPFLAAVATKGRAVVGVAHLGRRPTAHQQSALEWLYPTCAAEGCSATTHLENDHRVDWSFTAGRCSTSWTDCAATTTTVRRSTTGPSSWAGASGPSCRPTTRATPDMPGPAPRGPAVSAVVGG